ncbi:MAG TPA: sigma-70 family RNA polymerase sigma factor [Acidimicrobiales bacterium]|nr:sigma-70 family RNA polymerase sigma factor [Acidimicrobiales bacterium]
MTVVLQNEQEDALVGVAGLTPDYEAQFAALYTLALRPAQRVLAEPSDAEDVAAETLARLYLHWSKLSQRCDLAPWVLRVATNLAIDQVRRRRPWPVHRLFVTDDTDATERRLVVARAVRDLPRRQRQVVSLRYFADLTDTQIAAALALGLPTVRTHLRRALKALKVDLGPSKGVLDVLD